MSAGPKWTTEEKQTLVRIMAMAENETVGFEVAAKELKTRNPNACHIQYRRLKSTNSIKKYLSPEVARLIPDAPKHRGRSVDYEWTFDDLTKLVNIVGGAQSTLRGLELAAKEWPKRKGTVYARYYAIKKAGSVQAFLDESPKHTSKVTKRGLAWTDEDLRKMVPIIQAGKSIVSGSLKAARLFTNRTRAACEIKYHELKRDGLLAQFGGTDEIIKTAPLKKIGSKWTEQERAILVQYKQKYGNYELASRVIGRDESKCIQAHWYIKNHGGLDKYLNMKLDEAVPVTDPAPSLKYNPHTPATLSLRDLIIEKITALSAIKGFRVKNDKFIIYL